MPVTPFRLSDKFVAQFEDRKPPFGFGILGELTYFRTYSRIKDTGENETWFETCRRVVEGAYTMQKRHIESLSLGWNAHQAQYSAQEMYERMFDMKFLPPGRGLWAMGSPITEERGLFASLFNCAFVSTDNIKEELSKPFLFLMDLSMLGCGVGYDTKGAEKIVVKGPNSKRSIETYQIPDTREGWVESVRALLESYFVGLPAVTFDYSLIRPAGAPIKGFGGTSAGSKPLQELHDALTMVLSKETGQPLSVTAIVDIMNLIGKAVVAGNVRRTSEIVFGDPKSTEYLDLKNYKINPHREAYGWTSNNSVFANLGMDYGDVCTRVRNNGEPGFIWLDNMRGYSRMNNGPDNKDNRVEGTNPCGEIPLESYEACNLVEVFPYKHKDLDDFLRTLKFAYLYAKTVTLSKTHWPETNRVMLRNRRIGCSVSGVAQFVGQRGLGTLQEWLVKGYDTIQKWDQVYSDWMAIPHSVKISTCKPSGTVSLLAGATPGIHFPKSRYYIRRVRMSKFSPLIQKLEKSGYKVEPCFGAEDTTSVVEVPVDIGPGIRTLVEVSMWEQLAMAAFMQRYWADNMVSCTVSFDPKTEGPQIQYALDYYQYQLKGISFLPNLAEGAYAQMPYQDITEKQYKDMTKDLKKLTFGKIKGEEVEPERFCTNDSCEIPLGVA
jgi:adenosylcobalamin-dependent ribonucleoside-triphosphate reductase